ncbi:Uncharacterized protein ImpH/VasB [hydrothermal vent metagenome]|uniref:Uncharacterized protein ImpH/VasB n=1 Tax=hydrothermal vent metagenome TaxID=652676 RepID=A0A3B0YVV8_9ZZZZ
MSNDLTQLEALKQKPEKFSFFLALRFIECASDEFPRLGESSRPGTDPVRLAQTPSLSFANATLDSFDAGKEGSPARLNSFFLGLFGPHGALPAHLTEYAKDRLQHSKDPTFSRFADLFHHRMLSLFYRAWANKEPTVSFEREASDHFKKYVGALFGQGMQALHQRDELPDRAKLFFSGLLANQVRSAEGLAAILSAYFNMPVAVNEFVGEWMSVPKESQWRLGESEETGTLGQTTLVGEKAYGCQHKFRLRFGPLTFAVFKRLLPGGEDLKCVAAAVKNYVGFQLDWDVNLVLQKDEVPGFVLGGDNQLGRSMWLHSGHASVDRGDTIIKGLAGEHNHG